MKCCYESMAIGMGDPKGAPGVAPYTGGSDSPGDEFAWVFFVMDNKAMF